MLYALLLDTPREAEIRIKDLRVSAGSDLRLLGWEEPLTWSQQGEDLVVALPTPLPNYSAYAIRVSH